MLQSLQLYTFSDVQMFHRQSFIWDQSNNFVKLYAQNWEKLVD